jgi:hypothetical protein
MPGKTPGFFISTPTQAFAFEEGDAILVDYHDYH